MSFDRDGNGTLNRSEFFSAMKLLNAPVVDETVLERVWRAVDHDGSASVNFKEFLQAFNLGIPLSLSLSLLSSLLL